MRIIEFQSEPICEIPYLNAGRGPGQFFEDRIPVHTAVVEGLPDELSGIVVTADLQGREMFEESAGQPPRLLGEILPERLAKDVLPLFEFEDGKSIIAGLAGDFFTVPALDKRGGTGDVTPVWDAFAAKFTLVTGVAGNHDTFGTRGKTRPPFPSHVRLLDGDVVKLAGLCVAGIGGIIGKPTRRNRRSENDFLTTLENLLRQRPDVVIMHDGPDGPESGQRGMPSARELLLRHHPCLVIRGHAHWKNPLAGFEGGLQILNVDARIVVLARQQNVTKAMRHSALNSLASQAQELDLGY